MYEGHESGHLDCASKCPCSSAMWRGSCWETMKPGVFGLQASLKTEKQKKKDTAFPMRKYAVKGE